MVLQFWKVKELCPQFADNIAEDIHQLNDCNFGRKFAATAQSFRKVPKLPIFVFEHAYTYGMFVSDFGLQKSDRA